MKPLLLCFLMLLVSTLVAQQSDPRFQNAAETLSFAAVERIQSEALGEERVLNIYLPQGFHPDSAKSYPVIYVLDGSAHEDFPHIAGLVQFLNMYELVPSSIVVGIANVDRYRDFTFPSEDAKDRESLPTSGGADAFMRFVGEEVLPLIAERYPVNEDRMLIGQSLGGLMATEFLMLQPDLFNRYMIVSPSLWWDKQSLVKSAKDYFNTHPEIKAEVFVSLGEEHRVMHKVADKLVKAMRESGNENLVVHYEPILTEDHATILHRAVYRGFEYFYPRDKK